jgi:hypothetical protein
MHFLVLDEIARRRVVEAFEQRTEAQRNHTSQHKD